ncbi:polyprenyl synthetase family protein [Nonomuraea sp. KC401]|uniref:Polyprenyl synthetase family protein n=1 Tax=Nonomuraea longispora TaxID=1848320 RepID=A0A4R4N7L1_9ACTN|nr:MULTISPECIES: polyprenyl synthetase family protein [Nonomuraea]NBE94014.1 polyprenyl synthetase family protein [Nonomuraea sp. K271]TDC04859.1 polyprenyl synthetase family protein [Nonomuraea longispora]TLF74577.1 polyprenyl synthetase family protein [Nonomuraea sp. KC401]
MPVSFTQHHLAARVDRRLSAFLDDWRAPVSDPGVEAAYGLLTDFILSGGKRIRPQLCYWGWRGAGGDDCDEIISAAAALELCHAGLLIHDDIMDGSQLRRGRATVHRNLAELHTGPGAEAFGQAGGILLGTLSLAWSDALLSSCGAEPPRLRAAHHLFDAMRTEVISGQYLDILGQLRSGASVDEALTMIRYKTAKYTVERPLQIGGALAGASLDLLDSYSDFGLPLGEAFQLRDDMLGTFGTSSETGKSALDDLREGKHTVMYAHAVQHATPAQLAHLRRWHGDPELSEERAAELRQILADTGAPAKVESMIEERVSAAMAALTAAQIKPEAQQALTVLADRLAHRTT